MYTFSAELKIIGVNPFVFVPDEVLSGIFRDSNKDRGTIPIFGEINGKSYRQTLLKYSGEWRLYINTTMLKNSPKRIGEVINVTVSLDIESREIMPPQKFVDSLNENNEAKKVFDSLSASAKLEIVRYLARLKTEESLEKNVQRAINFLLGRERFVGRDKP